MELLEFITLISLILMLGVSVILILIIQVFLMMFVQAILGILLFLVLVIPTFALCKLRSEDTEETDETEDASVFGCEEETNSTEQFRQWYRKQYGTWAPGTWEEYKHSTCQIIPWYSPHYEGQGSPCRRKGYPLRYEDKDPNLPQLTLSAGGGFVLQEGNFPPLGSLGCSSVPFTNPAPEKVSRNTEVYLGRAQLNEAAKFKHIDPTCKSEEDAEKKSLKRNSRYPQEVGEYNTVFQVNPDDFTLEPHTTHGRVMKSKQPVRNWKCKKVSDSEYEGTEECPMHAVFLAPEEDCHFSPEESRKTQKSGGSIKLLDLIIDKSKSKSRTRRKKQNSSSGCNLENSGIFTTPLTSRERAMRDSILQSLGAL